MNRNYYGFPLWTHARISWQTKHLISETNSSNISKLYCQLFTCFHIGKPNNSLKIFFFLFYSIIEKLCQAVVVRMDGQIVGNKMGIELLADSHVERKKSNKNLKKKMDSSMQERKLVRTACERSLFGSCFLVKHSGRITFSNTLT